MSVVYWDTMLFVYLIEQDPRFSPRVRQLLENIDTRGDTLCTSVLTFERY